MTTNVHIKSIPDLDTGKNVKRALWSKAHDPLAGVDSARAARIFDEFKGGWGIDSSDERFVMEVVGQWRLVEKLKALTKAASNAACYLGEAASLLDFSAESEDLEGVKVIQQLILDAFGALDEFLQLEGGFTNENT
jgi:hypothetical protein